MASTLRILDEGIALIIRKYPYARGSCDTAWGPGCLACAYGTPVRTYVPVHPFWGEFLQYLEKEGIRITSGRFHAMIQSYGGDPQSKYDCMGYDDSNFRNVLANLWIWSPDAMAALSRRLPAREP